MSEKSVSDLTEMKTKTKRYLLDVFNTLSSNNVTFRGTIDEIVIPSPQRFETVQNRAWRGLLHGVNYPLC